MAAVSDIPIVTIEAQDGMGIGCLRKMAGDPVNDFGGDVVDAAETGGLARKVARLEPLVCVKRREKLASKFKHRDYVRKFNT